ncbi:MAG: LEA type 2 family protein [Deinococcota bacterium]|nr:LEA type 2 family protein [Deinococcota bacterium]
MKVARLLLLLGFLVLGFLGLLAACAPRAQPGGEHLVQAPVFVLLPEGARIGKYNPPGAGATVVLQAAARVSNPNPYPVRVRPFDYELFVGDLLAGRGRTPAPVALDAQASADLRLEVEIDLSGQPLVLREVADVFAGAPLPFRVEAALELEAQGDLSSFERGSLFAGGARATQTVQPPALAYDPLESSVFMLEPGLPVVRVVARATNPGEIGYLVYGSDLQLLLDGQSIAFGDMRPSPVPAGGRGRVELLFYPDLTRLGEAGEAALSRALAGDEVALELRGDLRLDVFGLGGYAVPPDWQVRGPVAAR